MIYVLIEEATSESIPNGEVDIAAALEVTDIIRRKEIPPTDCMRQLKKRLMEVHQNPNLTRSTLKLIDLCVKNGGEHFLEAIAAREFMDYLVDYILLVRYNPKDPQIVRNEARYSVGQLVLLLLKQWSLYFDGRPLLSYVSQCVRKLETKNFQFPYIDTEAITSQFIDSEVPPDWLESDQCMICSNKFSLTNRKHHCRSCGGVYCGTHSSKFTPLPSLGIMELVRVCDVCYEKVQAKNTSRLMPQQDYGDYRPSNAAVDDDEDEMIKKALELSLQDTGVRANNNDNNNNNNNNISTSYDTPREEVYDEEDPEIKAAIEASLREFELEKKARDPYGWYEKQNQHQGGQTQSLQQSSNPQAPLSGYAPPNQYSDEPSDPYQNLLPTRQQHTPSNPFYSGEQQSLNMQYSSKDEVPPNYSSGMPQQQQQQPSEPQYSLGSQHDHNSQSFYRQHVYPQQTSNDQTQPSYPQQASHEPTYPQIPACPTGSSYLQPPSQQLNYQSSQQLPQKSAQPQSTVQSQVTALKLEDITPKEEDLINLFVTMVSQIQNDARKKQNVAFDRQLLALHTEVNILRPKLKKSLIDAKEKYDLFLQLHNKISTITKLYDQFFDRQLNSAWGNNNMNIVGMSPQVNDNIEPQHTPYPRNDPLTANSTGQRPRQSSNGSRIQSADVVRKHRMSSSGTVYPVEGFPSKVMNYKNQTVLPPMPAYPANSPIPSNFTGQSQGGQNINSYPEEYSQAHNNTDYGQHNVYAGENPISLPPLSTGYADDSIAFNSSPSPKTPVVTRNDTGYPVANESDQQNYDEYQEIPPLPSGLPPNLPYDNGSESPEARQQPPPQQQSAPYPTLFPTSQSNLFSVDNPVESQQSGGTYNESLEKASSRFPALETVEREYEENANQAPGKVDGCEGERLSRTSSHRSRYEPEPLIDL
ncbi:Vacuolar protein-sorting-associated protein 27 [Scheffersomyces spartinae]|uniref:Vacuolar protein sorting-associated protein 27 n=1 Tax=Scheffersomyces spartinae TaxID=45513 RepID=A0A9P7VD22_9ASCO|nr:Vacuolar protein-sorting-associated protein 27 [Scheffersomyces spartinae]KAG7195726.1 Vacuolar protein-sorting-associated protein 27 [Scheffersomyces spartinae]